MAEAKRMTIKKNIYKFEIRKRAQYIKQYKVREKSRIQKLIDTIKQPREEKQRPRKEEPPPRQGSFSTLMMGGAIIFALLILLAGWLYISALLAQPPIQPEAPKQLGLTIDIESRGIITAGDRRVNESVGYVRMATNMSGVTAYMVNISTYRDELPQEVFILLSEREQATGYDQFISSLRDEMAQKRILVNEIDFERLGRIPSNALVVVPSGIVPEELLGVNSKTDMGELISRGVVIVYIGHKFDRMISKEGIVRTVPQNQLPFPISFDELSRLESTEGFNLYQPLYGVRGGGFDANNFLIYGSVSVIKKGSGALLFLPQSLDGGWINEERRSDPVKAGKDVARLILETRWAETDGNPRVYEVMVENESMLKRDFFTNTFQGDERTLKVHFIAHGENNATMEELRYVPAKKEVAGFLHVEGGFEVVPKEVTEEDTRLNAILLANASERRPLFLKIERNGEEVGERTLQGTQSLRTTLSINSPIDVDSGEYIASIVDDRGTAYAQGYLKVAFININYTEIGGAQYLFVIEKEDRSSLRTGLRRIEVRIDDRYGPYVFENTNMTLINLATDPLGDLVPGKHEFEFSIGKIKRTVTIEKRKSSNIFTDPLFIGTIILSIGILGIGAFLARIEKVAYQIDIPDFPPIAKTNVPLKKEVILSLFDRINEEYKWVYSPLTIAEIRNGFKKMIHGGKPIYVTDYNVEYIMGKLEATGDIRENLGYYAPSIWEKKARYSSKYFALFRKIRDICVNNAVPFTQFEESTGCDTEITAVGQTMFVHIYDKERDLTALIRQTLGSIQKGLTLMIFENEGIKREFQSYLASSSKALLTLKLEVETGAVVLLTLEEFENKIKELKGV